MPDFRIGKLRFRTKIEKPSATLGKDPETGETVTTWETLADNVPTGFEPTATEDDKASKNTDVITGRFTVRFMNGLTGMCRVHHAERVFEINGSPVDLDGRRRFMTFEGVSTE